MRRPNESMPLARGGGAVTPPASESAASDALGWRVLSVTALGVMLCFVNASTLNVALPELVAPASASAEQASWILLSYMLVPTVLILVFGRLRRTCSAASGCTWRAGHAGGGQRSAQPGARPGASHPVPLRAGRRRGLDHPHHHLAAGRRLCHQRIGWAWGWASTPRCRLRPRAWGRSWGRDRQRLGLAGDLPPEHPAGRDCAVLGGARAAPGVPSRATSASTPSARRWPWRAWAAMVYALSMGGPKGWGRRPRRTRLARGRAGHGRLRLQLAAARHPWWT